MMEKLYYPGLDETLYTETLPNGLIVRVLPKRDFNRSFAVFATDYGGADRRFRVGDDWQDTPAGIAHYLEHKMFDMPYGNAMNKLAMQSASPNAFTSGDMTAYYFEATKNFELNLETLLDYVSTPYFTEESVEKERGIIAQEIGMYDDNPDWMVYHQLMENLYEHSPVRTSVAGTVESIGQITAEHLNRCHKAFYAPSNMVLAVVGNADPEQVLAAAERILPKDKSPKPVVDYGPAEGPLPLQKLATRSMEVAAPQFMIGGKVAPELWGKARQRQGLMGIMAVRTLFGRASKFYTTLYQKNILSNDFDADFDYTANAASLLFSGQSKHPEAVQEAILAAVDGVRRNGLDEKRFRQVRNAAMGSALFGMEDFDGVAVNLAQSAFYGYNSLDNQEIRAGISIDDCAKFLTDNITEEKLAMSLITPLTGGNA